MERPLTNAEIARKLLDIRVLMEFAGEPFFKFMAYERAAETIENAAPLADVLAGGRLLDEGLACDRKAGLATHEQFTKKRLLIQTLLRQQRRSD